MYGKQIKARLLFGGMSALLICGSFAVGEIQARYVSSVSKPFGYMLTSEKSEQPEDIIVKEEEMLPAEGDTSESTETPMDDNVGDAAQTETAEAETAPSDTDSASDAETTSAEDTKNTLTESEIQEKNDPTIIPEFMTEFYGDGPLVLRLDTARGKLRLKFTDGSENNAPVTGVRYSLDRGKTWYRLKNISEAALEEVGSDGYIMLDFSAADGMSGNGVSIYVGDGENNKCEVKAVKKGVSYIEYDESLPWLLEAVDGEKAEQVVIGQNIAGCTVEKNLEYMIKTDSGFTFEKADNDTLKKLIMAEVSTDGEAFRDTLTVGDGSDGEAAVPAGQYRMTYTWKFGDVTLYERIIPFFINYSVR